MFTRSGRAAGTIVTRAYLEECNKRQLLAIAKEFKLLVIAGQRQQILNSIMDQLTRRGVLESQQEARQSGTQGTGGAMETEVIGASASPGTPGGPGISLGEGSGSTTQTSQDVTPGGELEDLQLKLRLRETECNLMREERLKSEQERLISEQETRRSELELKKEEIKLQQQEKELELMHMRSRLPAASPQVSAPLEAPERNIITTPPRAVFDVGKHIALVPPFREGEIDSYFHAFERIANTLKWPEDMWALLLQCKLSGKAQEVCASLTLDQSLDYETVKKSILRAYELVPEAYRQKFRSTEKPADQSFVEFAQLKTVLFNKWCTASKVADFEQLRELILLEEFKKCIPERIVMYLNEQKVNTVSEAAVCADEFALTHRSNFSPMHRESRGNQGKNGKPWNKAKSPNSPPRNGNGNSAGAGNSGEARKCFACNEEGHLIRDCPSRSQSNEKESQNQRYRKPKAVSFVRNVAQCQPEAVSVRAETEECFGPFLFKGTVSLCDGEKEQIPITILRDTGAAQSLMLQSVLPFSDGSSCGSDALLLGVEMAGSRAPLHKVFLRSPLVTGLVQVGIREGLPVEGIALILGNDLAGERVFPTLEVIEHPVISESVCEGAQNVFPACAVTRAQARKNADEIILSDSFFCSDDPLCTSATSPKKEVENVLPIKPDFAFDVKRDSFVFAQQNDPSLASCWEASRVGGTDCAYGLDGDILVRKWCPPSAGEAEWNTVYQIVVPKAFRSQILSLSHDTFSGHLGVRKTYQRILRYFFWPGLKADVSDFCRSCHVCQVMGKPNQVIPPAPLKPVPAIGEPFEHIIIDCVGPLPKTKSGHRFLLTLMCVATRYPEAIPLRTIKAKPVIKALTNFFSTFGLARFLQSDNGSNFTSRVFSQVMESLAIKHIKSSAYHPESQGALERFHQTLKAMLKKFCLETGRQWDEGLPFLMLAARESVQESLGFSPAELVFGHTVRGPLRVLRDSVLAKPTSPAKGVLSYVSKFRERLHKAREVATAALTQCQGQMKERFDKKAVQREFAVGQKVLALLPIPSSAFQSKFCGPYVVERKLCETDYVVKTPDRKRKTRVCHVNMLKPYVDRASVAPVAVATVAPAAPSLYTPESDGLRVKNSAGARLQNSDVLRDLPTFLSHLEKGAQADIIALIENNTGLFSDTPSRTTVLAHDVDVRGHSPIKQHAYRVNPTKRELIKKEIDYLLGNNLAIPSSSAWSSPCLLVPKSDGSMRFCTDYRKVNNVTVADSYPLPRMEDCVDRVGAAKFVTKLDLLKGYWQVPLTERASNISAFVTPDGLYQYTVMPFGLRNAPATFQRLMRTVLSGVKDCEVYLDDVVVFSDTWADHIHTLREVFEKLLGANLTVNVAKCEFARATVTYLGRQVGQGKVRALDAKIKAITDYPKPKTRRDLRRFIGMSSFYRSYCKNFAAVVVPLTSLTSEKKPYVWSPACQHSFESCKALLCSTPVLAAPDFRRPFKLEVDACDSGAGAVLLQEDELGIDHPVCYYSKKFSGAQCNYSTVEKEALALILALQFFEVYVGSSPLPVLVYTDHNPLVFLKQMQNSNQRLMRWSLLVQDFNIEIRHKKGLDNVFADALSRVYC